MPPAEPLRSCVAVRGRLSSRRAGAAAELWKVWNVRRAEGGDLPRGCATAYDQHDTQIVQRALLLADIALCSIERVGSYCLSYVLAFARRSLGVRSLRAEARAFSLPPLSAFLPLLR